MDREFLSSPCPCNLEFERTDRVSVFFTDILFDTLAKHDERVVILLHAAQGAFYTRFKMPHDALGVKFMFTLELARILARELIKTNDTCPGKVCKTLAVLGRLLLAFRPVSGH